MPGGLGGFRIITEDGNDAAGRSVAAIGELNGDGQDEVLVGAHDVGSAAIGASGFDGAACIVLPSGDWIGHG